MNASWREQVNCEVIHTKWPDDRSTEVTTRSDTRTRISIVRTSTVAIASFCMATAPAVSPAGAEVISGSSNDSAATASQVSESISNELDSGSFEISAPEGAEFVTDDSGKVTFVASNGDSAALSSEITADGRTYIGDWSMSGGTATFAATSTQNASSSTGGVAEVQSQQGCRGVRRAECLRGHSYCGYRWYRYGLGANRSYPNNHGRQPHCLRY